jgi:Ca2+:H+ antiporter
VGWAGRAGLHVPLVLRTPAGEPLFSAASVARLTVQERFALPLIALLTALAGLANYQTWAPVPRFAVATVALAGLAWVVSFATEQLGERFGPAITGMLQSTLGNLPELFVVIFALQKGELVVAQTAIVGSIFANAMLVLGLVIVVGAHRAPDGVMRFSHRLPRDTATLLLVTVFIIVLLGLSLASHDPASHHVDTISAVGAVGLLVVYVAWVVPYLRSDTAPGEARAREMATGEEARGDEAAGREAGVDADAGHELSAERARRDEVTTEEARGQQVGRREAMGERHEPASGGPRLSLPLTLTLLFAAGVASAFVSDWFVNALSPAIVQLKISQAFAGLVIVAIAGNAVENTAGIVLAWKGRSDLAISVVKNSVAQIAAFLFPLLVLISFLLATTLTFALAPVYIGALLVMALAMWQVTADGEAAAFEGWALVALYVILATLTLYE